MTSVLMKMAEINVGYSKVNGFIKALAPKRMQKIIQHAFVDMFDNSDAKQ